MNARTLSALLLSLALGACVNPPGARVDPLLVQDFPQIVVLEGLQPWVLAAAPVVQSGPQQPLSVTVPVRAKVDWDTMAQYRFEFFDKDMRPIEPVMEWQPVRLTRAQTMLKASALDTNAANWRLILRPER